MVRYEPARPIPRRFDSAAREHRPRRGPSGHGGLSPGGEGTGSPTATAHSRSSRWSYRSHRGIGCPHGEWKCRRRRGGSCSVHRQHRAGFVFSTETPHWEPGEIGTGSSPASSINDLTSRKGEEGAIRENQASLCGVDWDLGPQAPRRVRTSLVDRCFRCRQRQASKATSPREPSACTWRRIGWRQGQRIWRQRLGWQR